MERVSAVYRCRHCCAVYKAGEFDSENLNVIQMVAGVYDWERMLPDIRRAALWDIHICDGCCPKFGLADLVGWE